MFDIILKGGTVYDGSGTPGRVADVGLLGAQVAKIAPRLNDKTAKNLDCRGLVVSPGFIDSQNHSDAYWQLLENPSLDSMLLQGFTTIIVGHCGASLAPLLGGGAWLPLERWSSLHTRNVDWYSFAEYAKWVSAMKPGCNAASFVGLSTLWCGLAGGLHALDSDADIAILKDSLAKAMKEGALGLSLGSSQAHEWITMEPALLPLLETVRKYKGTLSVHMRNSSAEILQSVEEAIGPALAAKVPVKLSHFKVQGQANWFHLDDALKILERSAASHELGFDIYPYETTQAPLSEYLPPWLENNWRDELLDNSTRKRAASWMEDTHEKLGDLVVGATASPMNISGKNLKSLATLWQKRVGETALDILLCGGQTVVFEQGLSEKQVQQLIRHPLSVIASNGAGFSVSEKRTSMMRQQAMHPRSFGASAKFLRQCRDGNLMPLSEALAKLTGKPAKLVGLKNRGELASGKPADIVVFDAAKIRDRASLKKPDLSPEGFVYVFVNGQLAVEHDKLTGVRAGSFLHRQMA